MGVVELQPRYPRDVDGIKADPDPDWSFDELLQELKSLDLKLSSSSPGPRPLKKRDVSGERSAGKPGECFRMRVSDKEFEITDCDEEILDRSSITIRRFGCDDLYLSDSEDENDLALQDQSHLMERVGLVEGALLELNHEHDLELKEDVRSQVTTLKIELLNENEKCSSALIQIHKYRDTRRELDRRFDTQYNRKIAEDLDSHLTTIQRDHELKSQIEERKIRSDAAFEEAKRKEKVLQLEKLRQENAKAEAEDKRRLVEEAKLAALEAEKMAAKEAVEKEANDQRLILEATKKQTNAQGVNLNQSKATASDGPKKTISAGDLVKAAESSIKAEKERRQKLEELCEMNNRLKGSSQQDFSSQERKIARAVRQITGTMDGVMQSAEFIKILNDHQCPHSVSLAAFAEKIVSQSYLFASTAFATGHVVVLVTSQVPHVMDIILAELHKACIYTVPKHISYSKSVFDSRESYHKDLGYREVDGKLESREDFLQRVKSYILLYAALVQTQVDGILNPHGLEAGWTWLATLLNHLPASIYTAVALESFLKDSLYTKYKAQFIKLLDVISQHFLKSLREQEKPGAGRYIASIQSYIEDKAFLQEPEGWRLQGKLLSNERVPTDAEHRQHQHGQQQYTQPQSRFYQY
ncbi:hypothetical protein QQ045_000846 [Rhodiola kirilowii]